MKPTPHGWPRLSSSIAYQDAATAIEWLCRAFSFELRLKVETDDGHIAHSELTYADAVIMVSQEEPNATRPWKRAMRSPKSLGGHTQSIMIYVDDAESHCANARANGARIVEPLALHDYGAEYWADKSYGAEDLEGHLWWITERVRS